MPLWHPCGRAGHVAHVGHAGMTSDIKRFTPRACATLMILEVVVQVPGADSRWEIKNPSPSGKRELLGGRGSSVGT